MAYRVGVVCSRGVGPDRGGRDRNEDNYLICQNGEIAYLDHEEEQRDEAEGTGVLVSVCDGMGGHDHGDVASTTAARVLAKLYRPGAPKSPARALLRYLKDSHHRLHWKARESGPVTMGTTVTVCWLLNRRAHWAQVGDSALFLFREDRLIRLTPEHTRNEFARRDGRPELPDGEHLIQNFIYGSRGIGDNATLRLQEGLDNGSEPLQREDRLLLCTDGVHGAVDEVSLSEVLRHTMGAQAAAVAAMERAIARGSTDNITAIVVDVGFDDEEDQADETWLDRTDEEETCAF